MARKVQTLYVDDLTGNEIPEGEGGPVAFALDGERYEIDLSNENADKFRELMGRYVGAARRNVTRGSGAHVGPPFVVVGWWPVGGGS
jgi:hypothetical protein